MLRFLADENFNNDIVRGLLRRVPDLDISVSRMLICLAQTTQPCSIGRRAQA